MEKITFTTIIKKIKTEDIQRFIFFFCLFTFYELAYFYFFSLAFNPSKIFYLGMYSLLFTIFISFFNHQTVRKALTLLFTIVTSALYFAEASYFNLFKSIALWSQILRVDEVAGIKETLGDFIDFKYIILFIPVFLLIGYYIISALNKKKKVAQPATDNDLSRKQKLICFVGAFVLLNLVTVFNATVLEDRNKVIIKNTTEYIRNYGLLDAFFINTFEPILKPLFSSKEATASDIESEFGIQQTENEQSNIYEGKNFVFVEAESIAPYAIDQTLTPMLYKLQTEGYSFDNYYSSRTNTFASEHAILTSFYLTPEKEAEPFSSTNSMPGLFSDLGYSTQSFHNFMETYYNRNVKMLELGFDAFYGGTELGIFEEQPNFPSDVELFENSFQYIENEEQFFAYYITVSAHGGYNIDTRPRLEDNLAIVKSVYPDYDERVQAYLASAMLTDQGIASLYHNLAATGQLEDTVIMIVGDHYPYGLNNAVLRSTFNITETLDIYKVPCIIWDASKPSETRSDVMSNVDILPTVANMFGLELSYGMGQDMFSENKADVLIEWYDNRSYSFMTATGGYDDLTGEIIGDLTKDEVRELKKRTYRREELNNSAYLRELLRDDS